MITREKLSHHISHLRSKHEHLDDQIIAMERNGNFDDVALTRLKKEKLHIKDEIELSLQKQRELL
jgi:uncharacterized protein YdcH (DUF465 family)